MSLLSNDSHFIKRWTFSKVWLEGGLLQFQTFQTLGDKFPRVFCFYEFSMIWYPSEEVSRLIDLPSFATQYVMHLSDGSFNRLFVILS